MYLTIFGLNPPWACPLRTLTLHNTKNHSSGFFSQKQAFFYQLFWANFEVRGYQKRWKYKVFQSLPSLSFSDTNCKSEFQVHFVSPATNHRTHHQITKHKTLPSLPFPPNFPHQSLHLSDQNSHCPKSTTYPQFWKSPRTPPADLICTAKKSSNSPYFHPAAEAIKIAASHRGWPLQWYHFDIIIMSFCHFKYHHT